MSWRESAINVVLEYEFGGLWDSVSSLERTLERAKDKAGKKKRDRMTKRRAELEKFDDDSLFEEARFSARQRGYEQGQSDESYSNSLSFD